MHPTIEATLKVIRKKSEDTGDDTYDVLEEWVREVGPRRLELNLRALGPTLDLGNGWLDMSDFIPEDGQPLGLEAAVITFERQLLYDALWDILHEIENPEPNARTQYVGRVQQEIAMNDPGAFGPRR